MVDSSSAEAQSPARFQHMAAELDAVDRDIQYYVCQWGIGTNVGEWAAEIGNTWRMSNDIYKAWRSIWRITNQIVPYFRHTTAGAFADMDMLMYVSRLILPKRRLTYTVLVSRHFLKKRNASTLVCGRSTSPL
jgi:hypothetical protein